MIIASSRDGTVKLWNCGTSSTIATMGNYNHPINKMILAKLPGQFEAAERESLGIKKMSKGI
jgi:proteasomal ATPase-associated factor 1